jgi:hypothetical protein
MGRPTASVFDKIITAKKWEPTKGETRMDFKVYLLTELILDMPLSGVTTAAMEHGHEWEEKARAAYEMLAGVDVEMCGFCTNDEGTIGASPDGFVGKDGSLEIKSPLKPEIHCGYMLNPQSLSDEYWVQTQGQLYVTGRRWTDLISYFSGMPMVTIRVTPHAEFQQKLDVALRSFVCELSDLVTRAKAEGWIKEKKAAPDYSREWISQADVDAILAGRKAQDGNQPATNPN